MLYSLLIDDTMQKNTLLLIIALTATRDALANDGPIYESKAPSAAEELLRSNEMIIQQPAGCDKGGAIVSLRLAGQFSDAQSLALVSGIGSLRELTILGMPRANMPGLTEKGVTALVGSSNLTSLGFSCCPKSVMGIGVLRGVSKIKQLRSLKLYEAVAAPEDYVFLKDMTNLSRISLTGCPNFGDKELQFLMTLKQLKDLELIRTGVSSSAANQLRKSFGITHFVFTASTP